MLHLSTAVYCTCFQEFSDVFGIVDVTISESIQTKSHRLYNATFRRIDTLLGSLFRPQGKHSLRERSTPPSVRASVWLDLPGSSSSQNSWNRRRITGRDHLGSSYSVKKDRKSQENTPSPQTTNEQINRTLSVASRKSRISQGWMQALR